MLISVVLSFCSLNISVWMRQNSLWKCQINFSIYIIISPPRWVQLTTWLCSYINNIYSSDTLVESELNMYVPILFTGEQVCSHIRILRVCGFRASGYLQILLSLLFWRGQDQRSYHKKDFMYLADQTMSCNLEYMIYSI